MSNGDWFFFRRGITHGENGSRKTPSTSPDEALRHVSESTRRIWYGGSTWPRAL